MRSKLFAVPAVALAGLGLGLGLGSATSGSQLSAVTAPPTTVAAADPMPAMEGTMGAMGAMGAMGSAMGAMHGAGEMADLHGEMQDRMPADLAEACDRIHTEMSDDMAAMHDRATPPEGVTDAEHRAHHD